MLFGRYAAYRWHILLSVDPAKKSVKIYVMWFLKYYSPVWHNEAQWPSYRWLSYASTHALRRCCLDRHLSHNAHVTSLLVTVFFLHASIINSSRISFICQAWGQLMDVEETIWLVSRTAMSDERILGHNNTQQKER